MTGNLDFKINSTDAYLNLCEAEIEIIAEIEVIVAADKNITLLCAHR